MFDCFLLSPKYQLNSSDLNTPDKIVKTFENLKAFFSNWADSRQKVTRRKMFFFLICQNYHGAKHCAQTRYLNSKSKTDIFGFFLSTNKITDQVMKGFFFNEPLFILNEPSLHFLSNLNPI